VFVAVPRAGCPEGACSGRQLNILDSDRYGERRLSPPETSTSVGPLQLAVLATSAKVLMRNLLDLGHKCPHGAQQFRSTMAQVPLAPPPELSTKV
jgi:hypothetical protein